MCDVSRFKASRRFVFEARSQTSAKVDHISHPLPAGRNHHVLHSHRKPVILWFCVLALCALPTVRAIDPRGWAVLDTCFVIVEQDPFSSFTRGTLKEGAQDVEEQ
jgi:hypothetical protein